MDETRDEKIKRVNPELYKATHPDEPTTIDKAMRKIMALNRGNEEMRQQIDLLTTIKQTQEVTINLQTEIIALKDAELTALRARVQILKQYAVLPSPDDTQTTRTDQMIAYVRESEGSVLSVREALIRHYQSEKK